MKRNAGITVLIVLMSLVVGISASYYSAGPPPLMVFIGTVSFFASSVIAFRMFHVRAAFAEVVIACGIAVAVAMLTLVPETFPVSVVAAIAVRFAARAESVRPYIPVIVGAALFIPVVLVSGLYGLIALAGFLFAVCYREELKQRQRMDEIPEPPPAARRDSLASI